MLSVKNLHASVDDKEILRGIDLDVKAGEVHAIMGPNGSGKSTLASVLAGNEKFTVTAGSATFQGHDLLAMSIEDRARLGLFLGFQYPVEIPGVSMVNFMRAAINAKRKYHGMEPMSAGDFLKMMREKLKSFEGAYVSYYYTNAEGKEVNDIVYNKAALDKAVEKIMKDQGALNFKYIQEVTTKEAK